MDIKKCFPAHRGLWVTRCLEVNRTCDFYNLLHHFTGFLPHFYTMFTPFLEHFTPFYRIFTPFLQTCDFYKLLQNFYTLLQDFYPIFAPLYTILTPSLHHPFYQLHQHFAPSFYTKFFTILDQPVLWVANILELCESLVVLIVVQLLAYGDSGHHVTPKSATTVQQPLFRPKKNGPEIVTVPELPVIVTVLAWKKPAFVTTAILVVARYVVFDINFRSVIF